jgi:hypothetical protein
MLKQNKSHDPPKQRSSSKVIGPKQLAHEFGVDTHFIRTVLRVRFPARPDFYWQLNAKQADDVRRLLTRLLTEPKRDGGSR